MLMNHLFEEHVRCPISDVELTRRYEAVSKEMIAQDIDMLVMSNDNRYLGGYTRYFTDIPAEQAYPTSVLFFSDKEIISINSGGADNPLPPPWAQRRINKRFAAPYFRTLSFTNTLDAEIITNHIKSRGAKRVGLVGKGELNCVMVDYLRENSEAEIVDATRIVDEIRSEKSQEEVQLCLKSAAMHDEIMEYVCSIIKPGMYEYELRADIIKYLIEYGCEEQVILIGSAPHGMKTPELRAFFQNRRINDGDDIILLIEASAPGGYYSELQRTISLGEPTNELIDTFQFSAKLQNNIAKYFVPGAKTEEIYAAFNDMLIKNGYPPEGRLFAHGQGYDLIEYPGFRPGDDGIIKENMYISVHPAVSNEKALGVCCDNYLVTKDGAYRVQKTPQEILLAR